MVAKCPFVAEISQLSQKSRYFATYFQNNENYPWACNEQIVTDTALWHSIKELLFYKDTSIMVIVSNIYEVAFRSYSLFSTEM